MSSRDRAGSSSCSSGYSSGSDLGTCAWHDDSNRVSGEEAGARPSAVPRLQFNVPVVASNNSSVPNGQTNRGGLTSRASSGAVRVDVLSSAFQLDSAQEEHIVSTCAARLGVASTRLKVYRLVASGDDAKPDSQRVAIEVSGSELSLRALEELTAENQRLKSHIQSLQASPQKMAELHNENAALRKKLAESEALRQQGKDALVDIRREFEALIQELTWQRSTACGNLPPPQKTPLAERNNRPPAAVQDGLVFETAH